MLTRLVNHRTCYEEQSVHLTFVGIDRSDDTYQALQSEPFTLFDLEWNVILYPNGEEDDEYEWPDDEDNDEPLTKVEIKLNYRGINDSYRYHAAMTLEISNQLHNEKKAIRKVVTVFDEDEESSYFTLLKKSDFVDQDKGFIVDGKVHVVLSMTMFGENRKQLAEEKSSQWAKWWGKMPSLLKDNFASDFKIQVDGVTLPVHKVLLGLKSEVFKAMFSSEMTEGTSNELIISDFPLTTVQSMLHCIYDPKRARQELRQNASELLAIANKYQISDLTNLAEQYLVSHISADNAFSLLQLADLHNSFVLKDACMAVIVRHSATLLGDTDSTLATLGSALTGELLKYMATNFSHEPLPKKQKTETEKKQE